MVVASAPVKRPCDNEPFRAYPFCDSDRPAMDTESVKDPVVDELSVSVRVNESDLADTGERKSGVGRALEFARDVDIGGRDGS